LKAPLLFLYIIINLTYFRPLAIYLVIQLYIKVESFNKIKYIVGNVDKVDQFAKNKNHFANYIICNMGSSAIDTDTIPL